MLLDDIKDILFNLSLNETIYIGEIPLDAPDNVVVLSRIRGRPPEMDLEGISYRNPSIRIAVRDKSYLAAENRMQQIITALTDVYHVLDPEILGLFVESDVIPLGTDDKHRSTLYANFQVKHESKVI